MSGHPTWVKGVHLSSRYNLEYEIKTMQKIVEALPISVRPMIEGIYCDSKACACYTVTAIRQYATACRISELQRVFIEAGGFNDLELVDENGAKILGLGTYWPGKESLPA